MSSKCHECGAPIFKGRRTKVVTYRKLAGRNWPVRSAYLCSNACTAQYQAEWMGKHKGDRYQMRSWTYA